MHKIKKKVINGDSSKKIHYLTNYNISDKELSFNKE